MGQIKKQMDGGRDRRFPAGVATALLITLGFLGACFLLVGVGLLWGKSTVRGSCGGVASGTADESCSVCGGDPNLCTESGDERHYSRLMQEIQRSRPKREPIRRS